MTGGGQHTTVRVVPHRPRRSMTPPAQPRATFPKGERLAGKTTIQELIQTGHAVNEAPFRLVGKLMDTRTRATARIAFAVPKRNMPHAVDRNRQKRLMREAFRLNKQPWIERLRERGVRCAWLLIFQGKAPITQAETSRTTIRLIDRWLKEHLPATMKP